MEYNGDSGVSLDFSDAPLDIEKEMRKSKRGAFLLIALLVLMVTAIAWDRVRPDMSTYDGIVVLVSFLIVGFFIVFGMLAFVMLWVSQILNRMRDLEETMAEIDVRTLPRLDTPDDDIFSGD